MLEFFLIGCGFAFACAVQPGPLQAYLFASVTQKGWKATLPAAFSPLVSDGPIALVVLLILNRFPESISRSLQAAGGVFLIYLAWASYRQWKQQATSVQAVHPSAPRTLFQAATVNILNPNPYLGWSLVLGPAAITAWHRSPAHAVVLLTAFYAMMTTFLAGTILLFGTTRFLGPKIQRNLVLLSVLALAVLGIFQLAWSLPRLMSGGSASGRVQLDSPSISKNRFVGGANVDFPSVLTPSVHPSGRGLS